MVRSAEKPDELPGKDIIPAFSGLPIRLGSTGQTELRFLEFFYRRTAPHISGFYDNDFYNRLLLQAGQHEPAIRYAMMACGAMHEHYEFKVVPALEDRSQSTFALPTPPLAFASYNKAISALMKQLASGSGSVETVVMCCLLFTCLECLRGDPESAAAHLRSGGSILASWLSRKKTIKGYERQPPLNTPSSNDPSLVRDTLIPIFQRLGSHIAAVPVLSNACFSNLMRDDLATNDEILSGFQNLPQARNSLLGLLELAMRYVQGLALSKYERVLSEEEVKALLGVRQRFINWDRSYAELLKATDETTRNSRRALVLLIHRRGVDVILKTLLFTGQCALDEYMADFDFIVRSGKSILDGSASNGLADPQLGIFSLEEGMTMACYYVASRCRNPVLRRDAIKLLRQGPARQGFYNARLFAEVANRIVEYEENYVHETSLAALLSSASPYLQSTQPASPSLAGSHALGHAFLAWPDAPVDRMSHPDVESSLEQSVAYYSDLKRAASLIPEEARIHVVDIQENQGESHNHHIVTYMAKPDGLQTDWKIWTEHIFI